MSLKAKLRRMLLKGSGLLRYGWNPESKRVDVAHLEADGIIGQSKLGSFFCPVSYEFKVDVVPPRISPERWAQIEEQVRFENSFLDSGGSMVELEKLIEHLKDGWDGTDPIQ